MTILPKCRDLGCLLILIVGPVLMLGIALDALIRGIGDSGK